MLRHVPVLATEVLANVPTNFHTYFDGTFGHGGHVEYLLSHIPEVKAVVCDLDEAVMQKGLDFIKERKEQITPLLDTYAHIDQI
jgi:16S rRNA C1402 N4-methylase RsmH